MLTHAQRLERLQTRIEELPYWRERAAVPVDGWTLDGEAIGHGDAWPDAVGVHRFAAEAEAPADWPLDHVRLQLDLGGESLVTLSYPSGSEESFGLDPYHGEFPLRHHRFSIRAESVARFPFGQPNRDPRLNRAQLVLIEPEVDRLCLLLVQLCEAVDALGSHEVVPHLLAAGEAALRSLDWPSGTADYLGRMARSPGQQRIWQLPPSKADPEPLGPEQIRSVAAAYHDLLSELDRMRVLYPPQGKLLLTGHGHIDLAWLWPYAETRRKMRRTFHTALSLIERSKHFHFNQSTAHYYAQIEEDDPALFARIKAAVAAGQWEVLGGMWVEPDTNMPTGESLVRQILYGQRYFEKTFGARHTVCWLPDCFGFSGALPQLLRQGGIESFFTIKVNWSDTNRFPHDLFWWEGLDGSRVLAHTFDNPMHGYNGFVRPDCFVPTWTNFRGKTLHDTSLLAVGYGDGGGGVTPEMVAREEQLRHFPAIPEARWGKVGDFFAEAHRTAAKTELPVWSGEIYLELHRATLTTQSNVKRLHRQAERALITAETVASLAHLLGSALPESLEPDWRVVLKNEFHDILPGSSIREVYEDAERELSAVVAAGQGRQQTALEQIASLLPDGPVASGLLVVNPSLDPRPLRVVVDGEVITGDQPVPPLGIAMLDRTALRPVTGLAATDRSLENAFLRADIAADGSIARLVHKPSGRDALDGAGNQLWVYPADKPRDWDAWDIDEDYAARGERLHTAESITLVEQGPHRAAIRITHRFRASTVVQTYVLHANSRRLDIETEIDWHDRRVLLRALTPVAVRARHAVFECAFGVVERETHRNTSWQEAMFEAAAHRFVDLSESGFGVGLLNTAKYGHSAKGNVLGISLVRSPVYPDPLADEGAQRFTYALLPHEGDWVAGGGRAEAEDLNQPLLALSCPGKAAGTHIPLAVDGTEVAIATLKRCEDGSGLLLRIYEPAGARGPIDIRMPEGWRRSGALTLLEEPMGEPAATETILPFEVRSYRLQGS